MRYIKLGTTGLEVSAITLGCMSFGEPDRGGEPWSLGADASRDIIKQALESGVNFSDTAHGYSAGSSEEKAEREMFPLCGDQGIGVIQYAVTRSRHAPSDPSPARGARPIGLSRWEGRVPTERRLEYSVSEARVQTRIIRVQDGKATVEVTAILSPRDPAGFGDNKARLEASVLVTASVEGEGDRRVRP